MNGRLEGLKPVFASLIRARRNDFSDSFISSVSAGGYWVELTDRVSQPAGPRGTIYLRPSSVGLVPLFTVIQMA